MGARPHRLVGALLTVGLIAAAAAAPASAAPGRRCPKELRCLRVAVPLDRSGAVPGTIRLRVRIRPARPASGGSGETILALAGGPGQAAAPLVDTFVFALGRRTLRGRRLVAFDQRGTGASGHLRCPELARIPDDAALAADERVQRAVAGCARRLGAARSHYATSDSVADVEAVRAALGVERLVLYGTSYGTKVALDYAAAHPAHVSRLVLDSTLPPGGVDPFQRTTIGSIPRVLRALCAGRRCPFTSDAAGDLSVLAERLARGPIRGYRVDDNGRRKPAVVRQRDVFSLLLAGDLDPLLRDFVPAAVRGALTGDPALLLRLTAAPGASLEGPDSDALYLATTCADSVPWGPGTPIGARAKAVADALAAIPPQQLAPFGPAGVRDLGALDLCRAWPEAPIPQPSAPLPDVPAIVLSGDQDLRTPRADALALAAALPDARVVTIPTAGHSTLTSSLCAEDAVRAFLADRRIRRCRGERRSPLDRPVGLPPASLARLRPVGGLPPRAGRTLHAVVATFDLMGELLLPELLTSFDPQAERMSFGGLRGGSFVVARRAILLRRFSMIPGVTVSARLVTSGAREGESEEPPTELLIGGRTAARGRLHVGERWTTGRLGGRSVRVRTRALERVVAATASSSGPAAQAAAGGGSKGTPPGPRPQLWSFPRG